MTADPVAARLPYAIVTHLVELIGWKRLELNKLVHFSGVTEQTLDSIYRRSWVCVLQGRFVSEEVLQLIPEGSRISAAPCIVMC